MPQPHSDPTHQRRAPERSRRSPDDRRAAATPRRVRLVLAALLAIGVAVALGVALSSGSSAPRRVTGSTGARSGGSAPSLPAPRPPSSFAVGLRMMRIVDPSRTMTLADGSTQPRTLVTYVRYPANGAPGAGEHANAPAARTWGPFPLVVFGHGFDVTPALYARLLHAWAQAGYVVAAPLFPLENADAPGGPNEADLTNQPGDVSLVISSILGAGRLASGPLAGLVDPGAIAATGQSDGGDTALAVAYDPRYRDPRVGAAVILSGAEIPATGSFTFPASGPPLLATQGTADTVNPPASTTTFFEAAPRPKYLLQLLGAAHLPPYSEQQPQLSIVERVTLAFLDGYLKHRPAQLLRLGALGSVPGAASLVAEP